MKLTTVKATNYMREWMNLKAVKKVDENEAFLYFEAKDCTDNVQSYRVAKQLDSDNSFNIDIDDGVGFGWIDAIPAKEDEAQ